ncbi:ubiquinol-cytochrome C chaperone, partial [Mesorhizobium sp. M7A.F.Ca.CA.002.09.1.1]
VRPDAGAWLEASLLANYVTDARNHLAAQTSESIVSGTLTFPAAKEVEQ